MRLKIVGGLGENAPAMALCVSLWQRHGFDAEWLPFGWQKDDYNFDRAFRGLGDRLEQNDRIIGYGAGGVAAVLALLQQPDLVMRVAAVAAPLARSSSERSVLLNAGLAVLSHRLIDAAPYLSRIGLFRGRKDTVAYSLSATLGGAYNEELPVSGHLRTLVTATTVYRRRIATWLQDGQ